MKYRFFDIVVENESGEQSIDTEFVLDVADRDTSTAVERAELIGDMLDTVVAASGLSVCSFRSETVNL
jgi:hypothetical protein